LILATTRLEGGLVVHLGCGDASTTAEFLIGDGFRVHGLDPLAKNVAAARKSLLAGTQYGRIVIDRLEARSLPYADNLVNLLVVEDAALTTEAEIHRVLVPDGVAGIRESDTEWRQVVKARPGTMDHWQHFLRSPDNNPVSKDTMVGPPNRIQWMATPKFSRAHEQHASFSAAVSDGGKIFYILDDAPRVDIRLPSEWFIIARDAFNGIELWRRRMGDWVNQFRRFRSGPANLPFRLVAADGMVFVTMDFIDPVSVLDAKTGITIRTIPGSEKTKQIIYENGVLTLLIDEEVDQLENIDAARRRGKFMPHHCRIMKALAYSGEKQWEHKVDELVFPCMALKNGRIFGQTPGRVFSIDLKTGKEAWSAEFEAKLPVPAGKLKTGEMQWESPSIVVNDNVVLAADFTKVHACNVENGVVKWKGKSKQEYNAPPDLMLVGEDLWMRGNGARVAIDPGSGEVKTEIKTAKPYMHPRCYRGKAVGDYMLFGEMAVQMVNDRFQSHWSGWWKEGNRVASGRILSYDSDQIYGFGRDKYPGGNTGQWRGGEKYQLFAYDRGEAPPREVINRRGKKQKQPAQPTLKYRWTSDVPLLATALAATSDTVFIAGPPDRFSAIGDGAAALELKDVELALASWNGERGGILYAAAAADGQELAQIKIPAPTVFDGMAAANGRLFLSLQDGSVICLGKSE
jgi:outer membrane protein assembly factor BamB